MGVERLVALLVAAGGVPAAAAARRCTWWSSGARRRRCGRCSSSSGCAANAPAVRFELNVGGGNFKAQFRRADRSGALLALIIGEDELARGVVAVKPLRASCRSERVPDWRSWRPGMDAALAAVRGAACAPA